MCGTRIEKEVEICATNLANDTKYMSPMHACACSATIFIVYVLVISCRISLLSDGVDL
jgi:hypothetical protein